MGEHEPVPPEIAKTLVGWKKHFNAYTTQARFNVNLTNIFINIKHFLLKTVMLSLGLTAALTLYFTSGKKEKK